MDRSGSRWLVTIEFGAKDKGVGEREENEGGGGQRPSPNFTAGHHPHPRLVVMASESMRWTREQELGS